MSSKHVLGVCAAGFILLSLAVSADESDGQRRYQYTHFMLGDMAAENSWSIQDSVSGQKLSADINDLPIVGLMLQTPYSELTKRLAFGVETGGFYTWQGDKTNFDRLEGDVVVDSYLQLFDFSVGAYLSYQLGDLIRLYGAVGPSIYYGRMDVSDHGEEIPELYSGYQYRPTGTEYDLRVGAYGRAGIDLIFPNNFILGASARRVNVDMKFGGNGELSLDTTQYMVVFGHRF